MEEVIERRKLNIEHVIRDEDGKLKSVKPEDLDLSEHKGVKEAFKVLKGIRRRYVPSLEEQIEAYLYLEKHPCEDMLYSLKMLDLLDDSSINTYLHYLETGKTKRFLNVIKEDLCYKVAEDLFLLDSKKHLDFYNNYQRIGEAVISYYKSLKKKLGKPEVISSKETLYRSLGISFPLLTAKQRKAINNMLVDISTEERFHGYKPLGTIIDESQARLDDESEDTLFKAINYYRTGSFKKSNKEYKKLLIAEPQLTPLIKKFMHLNHHFIKKTDKTIKEYDDKLKELMKKKCPVRIVQDLREVGRSYRLKNFKIHGKLIEKVTPCLLEVWERALMEKEYDSFFIDSIHFELAMNYQGLNKMQKMLKHLKSITSEDLKPYAYWLAAQTYEDLGKNGNAVGYWKKLSETVPKEFETFHNRTNEVGRLKSPLLKNIIFKRNTEKRRPKTEFENTSFIFNKVKNKTFNIPMPIVYTETPEKGYACFKEAKSFVGKTLSISEELEHCRKELAKINKTVKQEHPWLNEQAVLKEHKRLIIKSVIEMIADMQTGINPKRIKKHVPEFKNYDYENVLEEKLAKRINKPEILTYSKPVTSYLEKQKRVFGHCDLNVTNILDLGGEFCFIDFEHSALTAPLFDLAYFLERPHFNLGKQNKKEMIDYFVSKLEGKGRKVEKPYEDYIYNAAFVNMRIIAGYISWAEKTGKKYARGISFHRKEAAKAIDEILERYEKDESLVKLKQVLKGLKIR